MNKYLQTKKSRHVICGKYEIITEDTEALPAMVTICNGEICIIPDEDGLQFVTQPKDRSDGKTVEFVTWENLGRFIGTLEELYEARVVLNLGK